MNKALFIYSSFNLNNNAHGIGWFGTDDIRDCTDFNQWADLQSLFITLWIQIMGYGAVILSIVTSLISIKRMYIYYHKSSRL